MNRLDLDAFNPEPNVIGFRGVDYAIPGEIPLSMIIEAAQYEERLREAEGEIQEVVRGGDLEALKAVGLKQKAVLEEMYALCMKLLRIENPDCPELDLTATDCGRLLALMASGGLDATIDKSIVAAIAGPEDERRPPARSKTGKKPAGSQPGRRSRSRSSS